MPIYPLYALLFADHGLSTAEISTLLVVWSLTSFVLEVPSGAWADTIDRRLLLVLGAVFLAAGFATWTVFPSYLGFAIGFVLWGTSGALQSGTFEALLYDELAARSATKLYARINGYGTGIAEISVVVSMVAATPLYAWGGYALVGWASVGVAIAHGLVALSLPRAPKVASVADVDDLEDDDDAPDEFVKPAEPALQRYLGMLRAGTSEVLHRPRVRHGVLLASLLFGFTAFDEYFGLLAGEHGVDTRDIPLLFALVFVGTVTGTFLAGRTTGMSARVMAIAVAVAGVLFGVGSLAGAVGFLAIGVAYGILYNTSIVAEARMQDSIEGPARATVTSVSGLLSEVVAVAVYALVGIGTLWLSLPVLVALFAVPMVAAAVLVPRWLPPKTDD